MRVRDIIKFGRVNFKISALNCDRIAQEYTGSCYQPPKTSRQKRHTEQIDDEEEEFGPLGDQSIQQKHLPGRHSEVEASVDHQANLTDMNLVQNDQTHI